MIELAPTTALMLYLALTLGVLLGIWVVNHYRSRHRQFLPPEHRLAVCEYCHYGYLADQGKEVSQCPQCQSFNR